MKKYSRNSKRTMKRSMRSKKMTRRRRQRGGGTIEIKCRLIGNIVRLVSPSPDPSISVSNMGMKTLTIKSTTPIKNIEFINTAPAKLAQPRKGIAPTEKVGDRGGIILRDMADNKTVIPASSHLYAKSQASGAKSLEITQKLLDMNVGATFTAGLKVTNLDIGNIGLTGGEVDFTVRITT